MGHGFGAGGNTGNNNNGEAVRGLKAEKGKDRRCVVM
jgi:hypothetical protein